jgi:hypothetical protein
MLQPFGLQICYQIKKHVNVIDYSCLQKQGTFIFDSTTNEATN